MFLTPVLFYYDQSSQILIHKLQLVIARIFSSRILEKYSKGNVIKFIQLFLLFNKGRIGVLELGHTISWGNLYTFLPDTATSNLLLVTWNWPWWEYLHHENGKHCKSAVLLVLFELHSSVSACMFMYLWVMQYFPISVWYYQIRLCDFLKLYSVGLEINKKTCITWILLKYFTIRRIKLLI